VKHILLFIVLVLSVSIASAGIKTLASGGNTNQAVAVSGTYANSQVDTVKFRLQGGEKTLGFGAYYADSVQVVEGIVRRVVNGTVCAVRAGDTLSVLSAASAIAGSQAATTYLDTVTLDPTAEEYWVIITYAGTVQGTTAPNLSYRLYRTFSK
jgi:hypothetical protein